MNIRVKIQIYVDQSVPLRATSLLLIASRLNTPPPPRGGRSKVQLSTQFFERLSFLSTRFATLYRTWHRWGCIVLWSCAVFETFHKVWFTYSNVNRRIIQFKYDGSGASTKPCEVDSHAAKLSGQAIQNWTLRLLPLLIGDREKDATDNVWQLTLQLKDIVDMWICVQKVSVPQVSYLNFLVQEYLESRRALAQQNNLKPSLKASLFMPLLSTDC